MRKSCFVIGSVGESELWACQLFLVDRNRRTQINRVRLERQAHESRCQTCSMTWFEHGNMAMVNYR